jgi:nickel/cobalt exporter
MPVNLIYYLTVSLLGGMHALEPGHGKTVVAAYLIGSRGRKIDAVLLGIVVTLTHTFSVILLAIAAKLASTRITLTEESLHGYLGLVAGLLILVVGIWMLVGRIRGHDHHDHGQLHDIENHHGLDTHSHERGHDLQSVEEHGEKRVGYWQLFVLGVSGGLVPCPAAIAILLAAVAVGRLGEGLTYILLFSLGLASVLIAIGIVVVSAGKLASRFMDAKRFARKISIASASMITLVGGVTLLNSMKHVI